MTVDWQRRRSSFNHDWLKNRFLTAVSSFMNILDGMVDDLETEQHFLLDTLAQWPDRAREVEVIVRDFETEMSPRSLFGQPPLSRCSEGTLAWLPEVVDLLWRRRVGVRELCAAAQVAVDEANLAYAEVTEAVSACQGTPSAQALMPYKARFGSFRSACGRVSETISRFPDRIMVA